jgi:hypothetical protein
MHAAMPNRVPALPKASRNWSAAISWHAAIHLWKLACILLPSGFFLRAKKLLSAAFWTPRSAGPLTLFNPCHSDGFCMTRNVSDCVFSILDAGCFSIFPLTGYLG